MSQSQIIPIQFTQESLLSLIVSRECSIAEVQPHLAAGLKRVMWREEEVLVCYQSYTTHEGASFEVNLVTPRRVIQARSRERGVLAMIFSRARAEVSVAAVKFADVREVRQTSPRHDEQRVIIDGQKPAALACRFGSPEQASRFTGVVRNAAEQAKPVTMPSPDGLADQLGKLAALFESKALTEEEFTVAKRKLLDAGR